MMIHMRRLLIAGAAATLASHAAAQTSGDSPKAFAPKEMGSDSVRATAQERMLALQASPLSHCLSFVPYPPMAKRHRQQGQALLSFEVSVNGTAESPSLLRSSGFPLLDKAAMDTLIFCTSNGTGDEKSQLKPGQYLFPITWHLE
jgi:TonB family protein